ncbi:MAG: hypothetical protein KDG89_07780 [Geminicoccaceae bacterium]|nr:hypothetical protein [Geminicoccaceae bacterium]
MPRITFGTVVKLLLASLVVGMVMAYFEASPVDVFYWARDNLRDALGDLFGWAQWSVTYVLLGAAVVVPVWLVFYLIKAFGRRQ